MKAEILRFKENKKGCPGVLIIDGELLCLTLEPDSKDPDRFQVPVGTYECKRFHGKKYENAFEVIVPGHTAILFHAGNFETDTTACILLGMTKGTNVIWNSMTAFNLFMKRMECVGEFELEVKNHEH